MNHDVHVPSSHEAYLYARFTITLSDMLIEGLPPLSGANEFWYITDLHYDPTYNTTAESCLEDRPNRGAYGDYECEPPWTLISSAIHDMAVKFGTPDFIVWGG